VKNQKQGTELYIFLFGEFGDNFQNASPSFGNLLWQLIINEAWKNNNAHCFVSNYDKHGLVLGIAEKDEQGYHNTHVYFNSNINHDRAEELIDQLNEQMFGLLPRATGEIVLS
jgi:predicted transcriptional regulator